MKATKILFLLIGLLTAVSMLASCQSYRQQEVAYQPIQAPQIVTTSVEVSGLDEKGTLRIIFDRESGECQSLVVNGVETTCNDDRYVIELKHTYFCTQSDADHPPNTKMYNLFNGDSKGMYCGNVLFLSEGANIRFQADAATRNRQCRVVGSTLICF
jgi:hypothetical protein